MTLREIQTTFMILMTAESETIATALSGILSCFLRDENREILVELVEEIRGNLGVEKAITLDKLGELKYLNALIQEGIRSCLACTRRW